MIKNGGKEEDRKKNVANNNKYIYLRIRFSTLSLACLLCTRGGLGDLGGLLAGCLCHFKIKIKLKIICEERKIIFISAKFKKKKFRG